MIPFIDEGLSDFVKGDRSEYTHPLLNTTLELSSTIWRYVEIAGCISQENVFVLHKLPRSRDCLEE
jgi:hypothetical protein